MSTLSTHVLDTARGRPAEGVPLVLEAQEGQGWRELARGETDADGRRRFGDVTLAPGTYRITFDTAAYFRRQDVEGFYPYVPVIFEIKSTSQHYHVPLLLSPYGFSTYRGS